MSEHDGCKLLRLLKNIFLPYILHWFLQCILEYIVLYTSASEASKDLAKTKRKESEKVHSIEWVCIWEKEEEVLCKMSEIKSLIEGKSTLLFSWYNATLCYMKGSESSLKADKDDDQVPEYTFRVQESESKRQYEQWIKGKERGCDFIKGECQRIRDGAGGGWCEWDRPTFQCDFLLQILNQTYQPLSSPETTIDAIFLDFNHIVCPLPKPKQSYSFFIVTSDQKFTPTYLFQAYDPTCLTCSAAGNCSLLVSI